ERCLAPHPRGEEEREASGLLLPSRPTDGEGDREERDGEGDDEAELVDEDPAEGVHPRDRAVEHPQRRGGGGLGVVAQLLWGVVEARDRGRRQQDEGEETEDPGGDGLPSRAPLDAHGDPDSGGVDAHRATSGVVRYCSRKRSSRLGGVIVRVWTPAAWTRPTTSATAVASTWQRASGRPSSELVTRPVTPLTDSSPTGWSVTACTWLLVLRRRSARVPVRTVCPARMMLTRSASASTSPRMWLERRTVAPSATRSRTTSWKTCSMSGSRPEVG